MIVITEAAVEHIAKVMQHWNAKAVRLALKGGGCSGFMYDYGLENEFTEDDILVEFGNAKLVIDPVSMTYLDDATLDWRADLTGERFVVNNPHVTQRCGCGASFSA